MARRVGDERKSVLALGRQEACGRAGDHERTGESACRVNHGNGDRSCMWFAPFGDEMPVPADRREIRALRSGESHQHAAHDAAMQGQPRTLLEMMPNHGARVLAKEADPLAAFADIVRHALPGCVANALQRRADQVLDAEITAVAGRASLRLDANRGFGRADALAFVAGLDPESIELFEQPCASDGWNDNAAVAAASPVPLMLDEPIYSLADISRAGGILGVGFCKVKLKRFGGLRRLRAALEAIRARGMRAVLGDGLGTDLSCWMEACVGAGLIHGAGEFNGFLKIREPLLASSLAFREGRLYVASNYALCIDWPAHRAAVTAKHVVQ